MVKRILVVDDEQDICFALEKVLTEYAFVVHSYEDPLVAKFNADLYDLIVLDIKMPDLNGFSLYRKIKRLDKKVKVGILTAG
jgi:DNA-binding response OmpR family regulator